MSTPIKELEQQIVRDISEALTRNGIVAGDAAVKNVSEKLIHYMDNNIHQSWSWDFQIEHAISDLYTKNFEPKPDKKECSHEWKQYVGFTNSYEYCTHCNIKKD